MLLGMGIHHVALACRDLEATHRFYTEACGFELVKAQVAPTDSPDGWAKHLFYDTGNGTEAHILVDGQSVFSYDVAFQDFEGTAFGFDVSVSEGSVIEMVVGAKGDRAFDATRFDLRVTHVPAPGALALAGLGGLLTCRRRRA